MTIKLKTLPQKISVCLTLVVLLEGSYIFSRRAEAQDFHQHDLMQVVSHFSSNTVSPINSIYQRSQQIKPIDNLPYDYFGTSVAISGNTAVVGAPLDDIGTGPNEGSAYVYVRSGETWTLQQKLTASDAEIENRFGTSVAIHGDTIIVGSPGVDLVVNLPGGGTQLVDRKGAAYIFTRSNSTWTQHTKLINSDDYLGDNYPAEEFGNAVAIDGDRLVVGARGDKTDNPGFSGTKGSASVYERAGSSWIRLTKIIPDNYGPYGRNVYFGHSVDISGTKVIIGALDYLSPTERGATLIYVPSFPNWIPEKIFTVNNVFLGQSVALEGGTAVIGGGGSGKAYVSSFDSVWSNPVELAPPTSPGSYFGYSVALSGDTVVIGTDEMIGAAHIYRKINGLWVHKFKRTGGGFFGSSVAVDQRTTLIGARNDAGTGSGTASVFVNVPAPPFDFNGNATSDVSIYRPAASDWYWTNSDGTGSSGTHFGINGDELTPGDFDGDGKTDIAVFRPSDGYWYILNSSTGTISYVLYGTSGDIPIPNDFDNDGKADTAIFRPSNSSWYWINSSNQNTGLVQFGQSGDKPLMADFDGDARGDLALFRPSTATFTWYNLTTSQTASQSYGLSTDIPTPGDFDGDLKTDIAVYRPSTSVFYRRNSSNSADVITTWGSSGDVPVVADYDGDAESDVAVYRPSTRVWYIINSGYNEIPGVSQNSILAYGASGDLAIPATYLP